MHRRLEGAAQLGRVHLHAPHRVVVAPGPLVVAPQLALHASLVIDRTFVPVARRDLGHVRADRRQRLHLRGHAQPTFPVVAPVQRHHAERIAGDQHAPGLRIPQREGEDAVEAVEPGGRRVLAVQRIDDLAVRAGLEGVGLPQSGLEFAVVVDLAVDRKGQCAILRAQRLRAAGRIDDRQPLVHEDGAGIDMDAAPVGATVALALGQLERLAAQRGQVVARLQAEDAEDRTHAMTLLGKEGPRPGPDTKKARILRCGLLRPGRGPGGIYAWLRPAARARLFAALRLRLRTRAGRRDDEAMSRP